ncbi:hypothetical protein [Paraburkholderia sp. SOS3]|uniref:hypothetical protein n=1 Tax=Paraburkholderia sp. SOS3 TaxID=1926494 RepID=UPI0012EBD6FD|nr:hypothetical protein [Paraburkholderia sp. SOS3]
MPQNGLNLGARLQVRHPDGDGPPRAADAAELQAPQDQPEAHGQAAEQLANPAQLSGGRLGGSFEVSRADATLDAYFASIEASYYAGVNQPPGFIQETIEEVAGVVSTFQYQGVVLYFEDAGDAEAEKNVIQRVSFAASTRIQLN